MSKYAPLTRHLKQRARDRVQMTFPDLEKLLGFPLPPSARRHRAWWSNNPSNSVMTRAWLAAGYQSREVDLERERLAFVRLNRTDDVDGGDADESPDHPLWGAMRGTVRIAPGVDLTEPALPEWEEAWIDEKAGRLAGDAT